jgi:hypothetical protein
MLSQFLYRRRHYLREAFEKCDPSSFSQISLIQSLFFAFFTFFAPTAYIFHRYFCRKTWPNHSIAMESSDGRGNKALFFPLAPSSAENYSVFVNTMKCFLRLIVE